MNLYELANERLFNVNCQAQLGEISLWQYHAKKPSFSINMLGHRVVG